METIAEFFKKVHKAGLSIGYLQKYGFFSPQLLNDVHEILDPLSYGRRFAMPGVEFYIKYKVPLRYRIDGKFIFKHGVVARVLEQSIELISLDRWREFEEHEIEFIPLVPWLSVRLYADDCFASVCDAPGYELQLKQFLAKVKDLLSKVLEVHQKIKCDMGFLLKRILLDPINFLDDPVPVFSELARLACNCEADFVNPDDVLKGTPYEFVEGEFLDARDGKAYRTVKIGKLEWFTENLDFDCPNSVRAAVGHFYEYSVLKEAVPDGWRLPTEREWLDCLDMVNLFGFGRVFDLQFAGGADYTENGVEFSGAGCEALFWCAGGFASSAEPLIETFNYGFCTENTACKIDTSVMAFDLENGFVGPTINPVTTFMDMGVEFRKMLPIRLVRPVSQ